MGPEVKMSSIVTRFDKIKKKNPGISDSDAMEQAMKGQEEFIKKIRKSDKEERKKPGLFERLKMGITGKTSEKNLSPAGRKYRRSKQNENKRSKYKRGK